MIPIIKYKLLNNELYNINNIELNKQQNIIHCVDFQYLSNPNVVGSTSMSPQLLQTQVIFKKLSINLNKHLISDDYILNYIQTEITKDFIKTISKLGNIRIKNDSTASKCNIILRELNKTTFKDASTKIINKLNLASNMLAVTGRIGSGKWIVSNSKTYENILEYLETPIGMPYVINNFVEDSIILMGRQNSIEQPGVHCFIGTDDNDNIHFTESENINGNIQLIVQYSIIEHGYSPQYQIMRIDTKDIIDSRIEKLLKIQSIYG